MSPRAGRATYPSAQPIFVRAPAMPGLILEPMAGFEPATYGLRNEINNLRALPSTRNDDAEQVPRSGPERTAAHPRGAGDEPRADLADPILRGLLAAQVTWLARHDPAALRRELIAILAALG